MASFRRVAVLLVAVVLSSAAPLALAWSAKGVQEPDTRRDRVDGFMFLTADQSPDGLRRVYFNGFQGQYVGYTTGYSTTFSPNLATLGTRHQTYPFQAWAMLGVWKDCNKDGYVGYGDQGLWEYHARLLPTDTPCGVTALPANPSKMTDGTWIPVHNDGVWVHEFLPIGYDNWMHNEDRTTDNNPWNFNDSQSRVWADWGQPGDSPGSKCAVNPQPRGTFYTFGSMLEYADCYASGRIEQNAAPAAGAAWETIKAQRNPWGREHDPSYVEPWDCSADPVATTRDPTYDGEAGVTRQVVEHPEPGGDNRTYVNASNTDYYVLGYNNVSSPRSPGVNPGGSPGGTVNETEAGFDQCHRRTDGDYDDGDLAYATEGDVANSGDKKTQTDHTLFYIEGRHTGAPWAITGRGAPTDLGVRPTGREGCNLEGSCNQGFWVGNTITAASRNPIVDRDALGAMPVTYLSYYASLGSAAMQKYSFVLPGIAGTYGAEACAQPDSGWSCVPAEWWPNNTMPREGSGVRPDPNDPTRGDPMGARVLDPFSVRDVDCFDESVSGAREQGISFGTLTGTWCDV